MVSQVARWVTAPEQERLWQSRPIQGEIGIIYVPESQLFTYAQQGETTFYAQSMQGVYRGFFEHNIQAGWVHIDHLDDYRLLYLPCPIMLTHKTAGKLRHWVAAGGPPPFILPSVASGGERGGGCPAYFGDRGRVGPTQPNYGLDEVFGARESYVEFTPDLLGDLRFNFSGIPVWGGIFLQAYRPTTGAAVGWYADGQVAAVDHTYGQGRTRLLGTMVGAGHAQHAPNGSAPLFPPLRGG